MTKGMAVLVHLLKFCFTLRRSLALHHGGQFRSGGDASKGPEHRMMTISKPLVSDNEQGQSPVLQLSVNKIQTPPNAFPFPSPLLLNSPSFSYVLLLLARVILDMPMVEKSSISFMPQAVFC